MRRRPSTGREVVEGSGDLPPLHLPGMRPGQAVRPDVFTRYLTDERIEPED